MQGYNLLTAHFSNNERITVEAYWCNDKGEDIQVEYTEAKEGDAAWEELLTHITIDQLHENTYKHIREQNDLFEEQVIKIGKERGLLYDINTDKGAVLKVAAETIFREFNEEELKEYLFIHKLNLFENDVIKSSKDRTRKSAIRKAKTIVEATLAACELYQAEVGKK
jgi:hypothetical protein